MMAIEISLAGDSYRGAVSITRQASAASPTVMVKSDRLRPLAVQQLRVSIKQIGDEAFIALDAILAALDLGLFEHH